MITRFSVTVLLALLLSQTVALPMISAQETATDACFGDVYRLMDREQRLYRSVVFGQKKSADLSIGSTRTDQSFRVWMKTAENAWRSLAQGFEGTTWSNVLMDEQADTAPRRGLLEQRQTPTSDLLPPLVQSLRALQCRLRAVCGLSRPQESADPFNPLAPVTMTVEGCLPVSFVPLQSCVPQTVTDLGFGACDDAVTGIMERETQLLHLVVVYDAAYRSILQFGGAFEGFLTDVRLPLLQPLWQALRVLGSFDHLPCFLSQCDE